MKFSVLDIAIAAAAAVVFFLAGQAPAQDMDGSLTVAGTGASHAPNKRPAGPF